MRWLAGIPMLLTLASVTAVTQAAGSGPAAGRVVLPAGTRIVLEIDRPVTAMESLEGAAVTLHAKKPVRIKGVAVLPKGMQFTGLLRRADPVREKKDKGKLVLELDSMVLPNLSLPELERTASTQAVRARGALIPGEGVPRPEIGRHTAQGVGAGLGVCGLWFLLFPPVALPCLVGGGITGASVAGRGASGPPAGFYVQGQTEFKVFLQQPLEIDLNQIAERKAGL